MKRRELLSGTAAAMTAGATVTAASAGGARTAAPSEMNEAVQRYYEACRAQHALWAAIDRGDLPDNNETDGPACDLVWETRNTVMAMPALSLSELVQKFRVYVHHNNGKIGSKQTEPDPIYVRWPEIEALLSELERIAGEVQ